MHPPRNHGAASMTFMRSLRYGAAAAALIAVLWPAGQGAVAASQKHAAAATQPAASAADTPVQMKHAGVAHWGYEGPGGPESWSRLSSDYEVCGTGMTQSPIDFSAPVPADLGALGQRYRPSALNIVNNGHTIQVNYDSGSALEIDGDVYDLVQFHFHTPSEHTVDGRAYPLEAHFVHKNAAGQLAVVGAFVQRGDSNLALSEIWQHLPTRAGEEQQVANTVINAGDLLPDDREYYRYMGSLTTPPCSEGVKWFVLKQPITADAEQIRRFTSIFAMNARPVRPVNGRLVVGE